MRWMCRGEGRVGGKEGEEEQGKRRQEQVIH
jgi:hypothetical protein